MDYTEPIGYSCKLFFGTKTRWLISVHWWDEGTCKTRFPDLPALLQRKGGESPSRRVTYSRGRAMSQRRGCLSVLSQQVLRLG